MSEVSAKRRAGTMDPIALMDMEEPEYPAPQQELIVFTNTGNTYYFANVTDLKPTTNGFKFKYTGVASGKVRTATFDNTATSGYTLSDM